MYYNRQRTYSEGENLEDILKKDPKDMTEQEKIIWKVEIFKQSEDMDDLIDEKIRMIQEERAKITEMVAGNQDMIKVYEEAVDRIAKKGR